MESVEPQEDLIRVFRCIIGLVHVDGELHEKERRWLNNIIQSSNLNAESKSQLKKELSNPLNYEEEFIKISNPFDQQKLIDWARVAFNIDGKYSPAEKQAFEKLLEHNKTTQSELTPDYLALGKAIAKDVDRSEIYKDLGNLAKKLNSKMTILQIFYPGFVIFNLLVETYNSHSSIIKALAWVVLFILLIYFGILMAL